MIALGYNETRIPSSVLAQSIGANPVTVRRVLGQLVAAGLVDTIPGPGGGARLTRKANRITAHDIYEAVGMPPFLVGHSKDPQQACSVSMCMPGIFARLEDAVADRAIPVLQKITLRSLIDQEMTKTESS